MIVQTESRCDKCGWELMVNVWKESHGENIKEYFCRNGCDLEDLNEDD